MKNQFKLALSLALLCSINISFADVPKRYYTFSQPLEKYNYFEDPITACQYLMRSLVGNRDVFEHAAPVSMAPIEVYTCFARRPDGRQDSLGAVYSIDESEVSQILIPGRSPVPTKDNEAKQKECKKKFLRDQAICASAVALTMGWGESVDLARSELREGLDTCFENNSLILQGCLQD